MPSCHASKAFSKSVRSTIPGGKTWASEARDFCHMHPNGKRKAAKKKAAPCTEHKGSAEFSNDGLSG